MFKLNELSEADQPNVKVENLKARWPHVSYFATKLIIEKISNWYFNLKEVRSLTLKNISFEAHEGDLLAIIGSVGAGKVKFIFLYNKGWF